MKQRSFAIVRWIPYFNTLSERNGFRFWIDGSILEYNP